MGLTSEYKGIWLGCKSAKIQSNESLWITQKEKKGHKTEAWNTINLYQIKSIILHGKIRMVSLNIEFQLGKGLSWPYLMALLFGQPQNTKQGFW